MEVGQSIEDDRRALEAEGAVKTRKIEVDFEHFEVKGRMRIIRVWCCIVWFLLYVVFIRCISLQNRLSTKRAFRPSAIY